MTTRRWLFATGLVTLWGQVVLLRELLVAFYGSELVLLLALGALMLATAFGALLGRTLRPPAETSVWPLFLGFAATLPLLVALLRALRLLFGGTPGADLPIGQQLLGLILSLAPFGLLAGLLFQRTAALFVTEGGTIGRAYAVESLGSLAGGLVATGLVAIGVQNLAGALLCSVVAVGAGRPAAGPRSIRRRILSAIVLVALGVALALSGPLDRRLTGLNLPGLLATADTPYGRTAVTGRLGQVAVFRDGALAAESQGTSAEAFVHLAALSCVSPRRIFLIGGTAEGLPAEVLKHGPERLEVAEMDRRAEALVRPLLPPAYGAALADPRTVLSFGDPKRILKRGGAYDLILSAAPEPTSGQANRFYTREFFRLARGHLTEGGVLAFRLRSSENLWSSALAVRNESVLKALRGAFPNILVLPGTEDLVLASAAPLARDPATLVARFHDRRIEARLVTPDLIAYLMTNDRVAAAEDLLARTTAPENTDARPACYPCTMLLWLSRFFPSLGTAALQRPLPLPWIAVPPLLLAGAALLGRRREAFRRALFVGAAGFAGMVLEGALLLSYQTRFGALYQDLGVLLTCFMGGLSLGAWGLDGPARRAGSGLAITGGAVAVALLCALVTGWETPLARLVTGALMVGAGAFVGAAFAWAGSAAGDAAPRRAASLYAADLAGGCLGALLGSALFLPFAGLPASAGLAALVALATALMV